MPRQHHLAKSIPFHRRSTRREVRPVPDRIAQLLDPRQGRVFDDGFVEGHGSAVLRLNKKFHINQCTECGSKDFYGLRLNKKSRPEWDIVSVAGRGLGGVANLDFSGVNR